MNSGEFLAGLFRAYYSKAAVQAPPSIEAREFGCGGFGEKISTRHIAFANAAELNAFLRGTVPFYISCSSAYYSKPDARPMAAKGFLGADLVYEFDSNDLKCRCTNEHDSWSCSCGASGRGIVESCPECGGGVGAENWVCPDCLEEVKREVLRLLAFIGRDFGISEGISVNFSGNRGYHMHLRSEAIKSLPKSARTELLDYLTAHNLEPKMLGFFRDERSKAMHCPPAEHAHGWAAHIEQKIAGLFEAGDAQMLASLGGIRVSESKDLLNNRSTVMEAMRKGALHQLPGKRTERFWNALIEYAVESTRFRIDRQTSIDASKIIRVPGTLHGSTGLVAAQLSIGQLKEFEPLSDAVVLPEHAVMVHVRSAPKLRIAKQEFGPFNNEDAELPCYAAAYLAAKGAAEVR